jgi:hypothetical protein
MKLLGVVPIYSVGAIRLALVAAAWLLCSALLAPICFFAAVILAGPHSSVLPSIVQPVVLVLCWIVFLAVPLLVARRVWRRTKLPPPSRVPSFEEWLTLADEERRRLQSGWNTYRGQGSEIAAAAAADFRARYAHLEGVGFAGHGVYHGGEWVIGVIVPRDFDTSVLPQLHLGIHVHASFFSDASPRDLINR